MRGREGRSDRGREGGREGRLREKGKAEGEREGVIIDVQVLFSLYFNGCSIIGKVTYVLSRNMQH